MTRETLSLFSFTENNLWCTLVQTVDYTWEVKMEKKLNATYVKPNSKLNFDITFSLEFSGDFSHY